MTLNSVIKQIRTVTLSQPQVNSFYFGDGVEWLKLDLKYPAALLQLTGAKPVPGGIDYSFTLLLSDLTHSTPEDVNTPTLIANTIEVQSDMLSILIDVLAFLDNPEYETDKPESTDFDVYDEVPVDDNVAAGAKLSFTLFAPMVRDRCVVDTNRTFITEDGNFYFITEDGEVFQQE